MSRLPCIALSVTLTLLLATAGQSTAQTASAVKFGPAYRRVLAEQGIDTVKLKAMPPRMPGVAGTTLADPLPGHTYDVFISTGTIPITFSRLVKGEDDNYHV